MGRHLQLSVVVTVACAIGCTAPDSSEDAGLPASWDLAAPAAGEWPTFKRDNLRTGLAPPEQMRGAMTAADACERWAYPATVPRTRANSGVLVAEIAGVPTVLAAVESCPDAIGTCTRDGRTYTGGFALAIEGSTGSEVFRTELPEGAQADLYAPTLADVDADGARELVLTSGNRPVLFALRTEDEPGGPRGSVQWVFRYDDDLPAGTSEGAPAVAQLDEDAAAEIVFGTQSTDHERPARVYVVDGLTGQRDGAPFLAGNRATLDDGCPSISKIDSSSPAVATIDSEPRIFLGGWDGAFHALALRDGELRAAWSYALPLFYGGPPYDYACGVAKVRSGAVVADLVPGGGLEVAFGMMGDNTPALEEDFAGAQVRVLDARTGELAGELLVADWKATPSAADVFGDGTTALVGARLRGYYAAAWTGEGLATTDPGWSVEWGDGRPYGSNRSSPAIGDIDGDGELEIVVGTEGEILEGEGRRGLTVLDAATGAVEWTWPPAGVTERASVASSPALGDVDGDGELEIAYLDADGVIRVIDSACP